MIEMLKKQVKIGKHYAIRHGNSPNLSIIRIDSESSFGGWNATKLKTGRTIRIKSAAKLRCEVELNPERETNPNVPKWRKVAA